MKIKTLVSVTLLCLSLITAAQGDVVSQAYEVALSDFRAPTTENGSATFKACNDCDTQLVRVTANTRYTLNGKTVRLVDFRKAIKRADDRETIPVIVLHHLESDTIKSIAVSL